MMNIEWGHSKVIELIECYRQKAELWDPTHNNYHVKTRKSEAWHEIAEKFNCDVEDIRGKMTSLLSSFRREKAKVLRRVIGGRGTDDYISNWFAFKNFSFLMERDLARSSIRTEAADGGEDLWIKMENAIEPLAEVQEVYGDETRSERTEEQQQTEPEQQQRQQPQPKQQQRPGPLKRRRPLVAPRRLLKTKCMANSSVLRNALETNSDECIAFGHLLATKLRKFDDHVRPIVMHHINNVVFDAEMGKYNNAYYDE